MNRFIVVTFRLWVPMKEFNVEADTEGTWISKVRTKTFLQA